MKSDVQLRNDVLDELNADPSVDAARIAVMVAGVLAICLPLIAHVV